MDPYRRYVPVKIRRVDFSTDPPAETEETRYLFFNNFAYNSAMEEVKKRGIKMPSQEEIARIKASGEVADQDLQAMMMKQTSVFLWAGFLTQATQRGEHLTPEEVGMWDVQEDQETLAAKLEEAVSAFAGTAAKKVGAAGDGAEGNAVAATKPPTFSTSTASSTSRSSESVAKDFADGVESGFGRQP